MNRMISEVLKERYGGKVLKLSLNAGCTCPNRDGKKGWGGCSFCTEGGSGEFASRPLPVREQILQAKELVDRKFPHAQPENERKYIAYFQPFSNTYGDISRLEVLYREALSFPEVVILSVATRPDCLPDEMIRLLGELNLQKPVWVELGLQTIHERTAEAFGRGYGLDVFADACRRLKAAGISVIVHVILGLPGESREDMLETVRYLAGMPQPPDGIKIQMLQILEGSRMAAEYKKDPFPLLTMEEYTDLVAECLKELPEEMTVHRVTGDPPRKLLIAPSWCTDKKRVLNQLKKKTGLYSVSSSGIS